jgi:hypothetical protein
LEDRNIHISHLEITNKMRPCDGGVGTEFPFGHRSGRQPKTYVKPEAAITVFGLLMMSGVLLETC